MKEEEKVNEHIHIPQIGLGCIQNNIYSHLFYVTKSGFTQKDPALGGNYM